jgi:hypothetical protein
MFRLILLLVVVGNISQFAVAATDSFATAGAQGFFMSWPDGWKLPASGKCMVIINVEMTRNFQALFIPEVSLPGFMNSITLRQTYLGMVARANDGSLKKSTRQWNKDRLKGALAEASKAHTAAMKQSGVIGFNGRAGSGNEQPQSQLTMSGGSVLKQTDSLQSVPRITQLGFVIDASSGKFYVLINDKIFMQYAYPANVLKNISRFSITSFDAPIKITHLKIITFDDFAPVKNDAYILSNPVLYAAPIQDPAIVAKEAMDKTTAAIAAKVAEDARQAGLIAEQIRIAQELEAKKQKELADLKARADAVVDAVSNPDGVWTEARSLPLASSGIVRFKVHGDGNILINVANEMNSKKPAYVIMMFGGNGSRSELQSNLAGGDKPVVLVGVDKPNANLGKEIEVMLIFDRATKTITAYANGEKLFEQVDRKFPMNLKYLGFAAAAGSVIYSDTEIVRIDARENFSPNYKPTGEFSARIALGSRNGKLEGWCIDEEKDASLKRFNQKSIAPNPWVAVDVKDTTGARILDIQDVSVSGDGLMYLLDGAGKAYRYNWDSKLFEKLSDIAANDAVSFEFISVGNKDAIYAVDVDTNTLYRYVANSWQANTAIKAKYVAVGSDGTVSVILPEGSAFIKKEGKGSWVEITGGMVRRVAVAHKELVYGINNAGQMLKMVGGSWVPVLAQNGKPLGILSEIAVNADGGLLASNSEMDIYSENISTILDDELPTVVAPMDPRVAVTEKKAVVAQESQEADANGVTIAKQSVSKKAVTRARGKKPRTGAVRSRRSKGRVVPTRARLAAKKSAISKAAKTKNANSKKSVARTGAAGKNNSVSQNGQMKSKALEDNEIEE